MENRTKHSAHNHFYYKQIFKGVQWRSFIEASKVDGQVDANTALQIYRDAPVHLRVNIISNPLLNANVFAKYVAKRMSEGGKLSMIFKDMLKCM
jgi:hypothetical protein